MKNALFFPFTVLCRILHPLLKYRRFLCALPCPSEKNPTKSRMHSEIILHIANSVWEFSHKVFIGQSIGFIV